MKQCSIAIFASGNGSNAENIIQHAHHVEGVAVSQIFTDNHKAGIIERSQRLNIPVTTISKKELSERSFINSLRENFDYIVLAGFLLLIPKMVIKHFQNRIINLHPSLLPKFGGKGMYGMKVHKAVIEAQEKESGITIHLVNEEYDKGKQLFQSQLEISQNETPESLASRIRQLEHQHFPKVIFDYMLNRP